jgi:WD40 repeat protein/Leucine-rich repeat (LRR) protein
MERHLRLHPFAAWRVLIFLLTLIGPGGSLRAQFPITRDYSRSGITDDELASLVDIPNLESLSLGGKAITDARLASVGKLAGLRSLTLERTAITDAGLAQLVGLTKLELLSIGSPHITDAGLEQIGKLSGLKSLIIDGVDVTPDGIRHLAQLKRLGLLRLHGNAITDDHLVNVARIESLTDLFLVQTAVTNQGLSHLSPLYGLRRLNLSGSSGVKAEGAIPWEKAKQGARDFEPMVLQLIIDDRTHLHSHAQAIGQLQANAVAELKGQPNIAIEYDEQQVATALTITDAEVSDEQIALLLQLRGLQKVKLVNAHASKSGWSQLRRLPYLVDLVLDLQGPDITDSALRPLAGNSLTELKIAETRITDEGLRSLKDCEIRRLSIASTLMTDTGLRHIRLGPVSDLRLSSAGITDDGLEDLKRAIGLTLLSLEDSRITDAGLPRLIDLRVLQSLSVAGTQVTDAGLASIAKMAKVRALNLSRTGITDAGLPLLSGLEKLEYLSLSGTQVTDAGLALISRMPAIQVLDVSHTAISDQGLIPLQDLKLVFLDLSGTRVTDRGLVYLKSFIIPNWMMISPSLKLEGTAVTQAGLKSLISGARGDDHEVAFDDRVLEVQPFGRHRVRNDRWGNEFLACSPDSKYLAIGQMTPTTVGPDGLSRSPRTGRIELWNLQIPGYIILEDGIETHIDPTQFAVAFSPDGTRLAAASNAGRVHVWDLNRKPIGDPRVIQFTSKGMNATIATALCFSPDSKRLIVGTPWLRAFDVDTAKEIEILNNRDIEISFGTSVLDFAADADQLAVASHSGVDLHDMRQGSVTKLFEPSAVGRVSFFKFLPDNRHGILIGKPAFSSSQFVHLCNLRNQSPVSSIPLTGSDPLWLAISGDGKKLALQDVAIRKSEAYQAWRKQTRQGETYNSIPVMISIWRIQEGVPELIGQINTGTEPVTAITMTPDGKTLITLGQSLRFWDIGQVQ